MLDALLARFRAGDRQALARLLSLAARGQHLSDLAAALPAPGKSSRVVAFTGGGGVGKSTLIGKLIDHVRSLNLTVAVLACDPRSPLSGGALLGDRFRMPSRTEDEGVYIRSLSAGAGTGAVAKHLDVMIRLVEAFGFDVVLIETVGAGQGDTAVRDLADCVVLLVQPEMGDDLQWEKAGVLEVADIVVIHKADLPGAAQAESQVRSMLGLSHGKDTPILRVSARAAEGVAALWSAVVACPGRRGGLAVHGRELLRAAQETLADWFAGAENDTHSGVPQLVSEWGQGTLDRNQAVAALARLWERSFQV